MSQKRPSSDHPNELTQTADVLERNVTGLLARAHTPPRMSDIARARVLTNLKRKVRERASADSDADGRTRDTERHASRRRNAWRWGAIGGGVLAAAALTFLLLRPGEHKPSTPQVHQNAALAPEPLVLADGTEIVLDTGASFTVLGPRHIRVERGQAMLDVAKSDTPFTVDAPHGRIVVLGTRFSLDADKQKTVASVVRGVVRIENQYGSQTLRAGEQGALLPEREPTRRRAPRLSHLLGWTKGVQRDSERDDIEPIRKGTLIARNPQWNVQDYPLPLRDFTLDVHVDGGVARVAIDQTFFNAQPMQLEGVYRFALPPGAAISRLAMYVDGKRMEAAVIERLRARRIYDSIVYRRRDPALLEWMSGNEFKMRVFPLPARQEKRIALSYTQTLTRLYRDTRIEVPIPDVGTPVSQVRYHVRLVDCANCQVRSTSHEITESRDGDDKLVIFERQGYTIGDDLILLVREPESEPLVKIAHVTQKSARYLQVRVQPDLPDPKVNERAPHSARVSRTWMILCDTSGSQDPRERRAQRFVIDKLLTELDEDARVGVLAFDATVRTWSPSFVRVGDVNRADIGRFLADESRDGIGHTDLALALRHASEMASSADVDALHVLYVGDGVVTAGDEDADRTAQAMRQALGPNAVFVAAAVGQNIDYPLLEQLATSTGGMVSTMTPGDDIGWRAFDLVAAFNTPRVVELKALFLDDREAPMADIEGYLSATQIADGETIDIVARWSQVDARGVLSKRTVTLPAFVEFRGRVSGASWTTRIPLDAAAFDSQAGYLSRIWAKRRLDALIAESKHARPLEHESKKRDIQKEIIALGKQYFLMTPYTSLMVLENDAMYRQYRVSRKRAKGWAEYELPDRIEVVREPIGAVASVEADRNAVLIRNPVQLLQAPYAGTYPGWGDAFAGENGRRPSGIGTLGVSSGTGEKYGRATGGVFGDLATDALRGRVARTSKAAVTSDIKSLEAPDEQPNVPPLDDAFASSDNDDDVLANAEDEISSQALRASSTAWTGLIGAGAGKRRAQRVQQQTSLGVGAGRGYGEMTRTRWSGGSGGLSHHFYYQQMGAPVPRAMHYAHDQRLDDLTEHVPGLFRDALDLDLRELRTRARTSATTGSLTNSARTLIDRARKTMAVAGHWKTSTGDRVTIDDGGQFSIERTLPTGLLERVVYTGERLYHTYPELGIATRRLTRHVQPIIYDHLLPFQLPAAEQLAYWYHVSTTSDRTLLLRGQTKSAQGPQSADAAASKRPSSIEIILDEQLRIVGVRARVGENNAFSRTIQYANGRISIRQGSETIELQRVDAQTTDTAIRVIETDWTVVDMPLRQPSYYQASSADDTVDVVEWRRMQQQRIASHAALQQGQMAWNALVEIADKVGPPTRGELALASIGARFAGKRTVLQRILGKRVDPVADYLAASHEYRHGYRIGGFTTIADRKHDTHLSLVSTLSNYRAALYLINRGRVAASQARVTNVIKHAPETPLAYIAAYTFSNYFSWNARDRALAVWDAGKGSWWSPFGRFESARILSYAGRYDEAADRFEALFTDNQSVRVNNQVSSAFLNSSRGQAGWRRFWIGWRDRMINTGDPRKLADLIRSALATGQVGDIDHAVARATALTIAEPRDALELAQALMVAGRDAAALRVMQTWLPESDSSDPKNDEPMVPGDTTVAAIWSSASYIAERQSRYLDAARLVNASMTWRAQVELSAVRAHYTRLIALYTKGAQASAGAERTRVVDSALRSVADWRSLDPDNAEVDRQAAELLYSMGRPDDAWRYLSTAIEAHPMEGSAYQIAADVLERHGHTAHAERLWRRASRVDQTNPTWLLRQAQALYAMGRADEARAIARTIQSRSWHERFRSVKQQARRLAK